MISRFAPGPASRDVRLHLAYQGGSARASGSRQTRRSERLVVPTTTSQKAKRPCLPAHHPVRSWPRVSLRRAHRAHTARISRLAEERQAHPPEESGYINIGKTPYAVLRIHGPSSMHRRATGPIDVVPPIALIPFRVEPGPSVFGIPWRPDSTDTQGLVNPASGKNRPPTVRPFSSSWARKRSGVGAPASSPAHRGPRHRRPHPAPPVMDGSMRPPSGVQDLGDNAKPDGRW